MSLALTIHIEWLVRTNIEIDDASMAAAMSASGLPTKKATIEEALRRLIRHGAQVRALSALHGIGWDGDLDASREGRFRDRLR